MPTYDSFAKHYDNVMGSPEVQVEFIQERIQTHNPEAKTVLELGCGTGSILKRLEDYDRYGIDESKEMLEVAKENVPEGTFLKADITDFSIRKEFDVVLCMFDTLNHLLSFNEWKQLFHNVKEHLATDGVFIFDMNTERKFRRNSVEPPLVKRWNNNVSITSTTYENSILTYRVEVFEHQAGQTYRKQETRIKETAFPLEDVKKALQEHFTHVTTHDLEQGEIGTRTERAYVVCNA